LYSGVLQRILFTDAIDDRCLQYSKQDIVLVQETPELYERVVKPFITAFPPSRTKWVEEIIVGRKEADKVLHRDDSGSFGYMIIPDMKWNLETVSDLYLLALCTSSGIRSLRDLRKVHLPVLRNIKDEATRIVKARWNNDGKDVSLRMFIHYQPSYCMSPRLSQLLPADLRNAQIISTFTS
jgi:m7GpppX diphosphatase